MGGRYVNKPRQWFFWRSRNHDSLAVERLGNYLDAGQSKDPSGLLITGSSTHAASPGFSTAIAPISIACCIPATMTI